MKVIDHSSQPLETWREGVTTKMRISAPLGAHQLCIFEQWCEPGLGAPTHQHAVEEVLTVLDGQAEIWLGEESATVTENQSILVPAGHMHGFRNSGGGVLHVQAVLAAPIFEASYQDRAEISRRWVPEPSG